MILYPQKRTRGLYRHDPQPAAPVTLPAVTMQTVSDAEADAALGLPLDPDGIAQRKAETYLRAVIAHRLREAAKPPITVPAVVHVEVDDDALFLAHVVDRDIAVELQRLVNRPPCRRMRTDPGQMAS